MRNILVLLLIINISSCASINEELVDCSLPVVNGTPPLSDDFVGVWHYQLTNGNSKEWKSCDFKIDQTYSCEISEQGPIDKSGKLLEVDSYFKSGNWKVDSNGFTYWLPFKMVIFSKNSFQIENEAGYSELFFRNKSCVSSL